MKSQMICLMLVFSFSCFVFALFCFETGHLSIAQDGLDGTHSVAQAAFELL